MNNNQIRIATRPPEPDENSFDVTFRIMTDNDIDAGMELKERAGWNQTRQDWKNFLFLRPEGCFVAVIGETIVGMVTTINYDNAFSWIGMVLVSAEHRRKGIGTGLLNVAIKSLENCETIKLDATPAGKKVYDRLGFVDEYELVMMTCPAFHLNPGFPPSELTVKPIAAGDLAQIAEFDAAIFGRNRLPVLQAWWKNSPEYACFTCEGERISGYCLGRKGTNFECIGPLVSNTHKQAEVLLLHALQNTKGRPVLINSFLHTPKFLTFLEGLGFSRQRSLNRMYRGTNSCPGKPEKQWAVCGPEVG